MINLFYEEHDAKWEAWHDVEYDPKNGVCIGSGHTKTEALFNAGLELHRELNDRKITKKEHDDLMAQIEWILNRMENWPE